MLTAGGVSPRRPFGLVLRAVAKTQGPGETQERNSDSNSRSRAEADAGMGAGRPQHELTSFPRKRESIVLLLLKL